LTENIILSSLNPHLLVCVVGSAFPDCHRAGLDASCLEQVRNSQDRGGERDVQGPSDMVDSELGHGCWADAEPGIKKAAH
jgi:hypothetical protein